MQKRICSFFWCRKSVRRNDAQLKYEHRAHKKQANMWLVS
ncbi:MAG: hypothetical protein JWQ40_3782 [Segetibacter sp.]|nr:hypothetical protein [Segetibacter sp.]